MPILKTSYEKILEDLEETLTAVTGLGLRWANSRFDRYRAALSEATRWKLPKRFEPHEEHRHQVLLEAGAQVYQLIQSRAFWSQLQQEKLVRMLKKIFKGADLPPLEPTSDDPSRNALLELTTAKYLHAVGFGVEITDDREDVVARAAGYEFSVECKRPASSKSVEPNLKRLVEQLGRRKALGGRLGHAVVGLDRVFIQQPTYFGGGLAEFLPMLESLMVKVTSALAQTAEVRTDLGTVATLGTAILSFPAYVAGESCVYNVERAAVFPLNDSEETRRVVAAVRPLYARLSPG